MLAPLHHARGRAGWAGGWVGQRRGARTSKRVRRWLARAQRAAGPSTPQSSPPRLSSLCERPATLWTLLVCRAACWWPVRALPAWARAGGGRVRACRQQRCPRSRDSARSRHAPPPSPGRTHVRCCCCCCCLRAHLVRGAARRLRPPRCWSTGALAVAGPSAEHPAEVWEEGRARNGRLGRAIARFNARARPPQRSRTPRCSRHRPSSTRSPRCTRQPAHHGVVWLRPR